MNYLDMLNMSLDLVRYLFVLEVNTSLIWLPKWPALELSLFLGETIAERLPIVQARAWKKSLAAWNAASQDISRRKGEVQGPIHQSPWPIDAVIFWYPAKRSYGKGERILFELKLMGDAAEHDFFIEVILPAMEQIAMSHYTASKYANSLWGHFDIRSVYSAKGSSWRPLLKNGRLDLRRKVTSTQWYKGIKHGSTSSSSRVQLTWLSPFLLYGFDRANIPHGKKTPVVTPKLSFILESVAERISSLLLGKYSSAQEFLTSLDLDERLAWMQAMDLAAYVPIYNSDIKPSSDLMSGLGRGYQTFARHIPDAVIPYLELGSILHIGEYTHFGCGTYVISGIFL